MNKINRTNSYRMVEKLPKNAMTVREYAEKYHCNNSYIYKLWKQHTKGEKNINFEIVLYKGINFIIPQK